MSSTLSRKCTSQPPANRPIELRRVTFSDVSTLVDGTLVDGPTQHTRATTREAATIGQSTTTVSTLGQADSQRSLSPIELRSITFYDVATLVDGPIHHTKASTQQGATMGKSTTIVSTLGQADSQRSLSNNPQSGFATKETIINDDLASPIIPH